MYNIARSCFQIKEHPPQMQKKGSRRDDLVFRALAVHAEELGMISSTHTVADNACNSSFKGSDNFFRPLRALNSLVHTQTCR